MWSCWKIEGNNFIISLFLNQGDKVKNLVGLVNLDLQKKISYLARLKFGKAKGAYALNGAYALKDLEFTVFF